MTQHKESALALAVNARDLRSDCGCQFKGLQLCANSLRDLSELSAESCQVSCMLTQLTCASGCSGEMVAMPLNARII